jgi:hypothetical protein
MSNKLKALGLGLFAMMAMGAVAVMNASANGEGHFVSSVAHTEIKGTEEGAHHLDLIVHGFGEGEEIGCNKTTYTATTTNLTENDLTVTPTYAECYTTQHPETKVTVKPNGCTYTFTVAKGTTNATEQTVDVLCPAGSSIEVIHPNCTIKIPAQKVLTGVTYTRVEEVGKPDWVTLDSNPTFNTQFEGGICVFLGTSHTGTLKGSVTVKGSNTAGEPVSVTAT